MGSFWNYVVRPHVGRETLVRCANGGKLSPVLPYSDSQSPPAFMCSGPNHDYAKPFGRLDFVLYAANVILCPPILLFIWCIDCEYGTPAGFQTNLIIVGLLNAAL